MPTVIVRYAWKVQQVFNLGFMYSVVDNVQAPKLKNYITQEQINSIYKPTIIYPNGGETIRAREIEIAWHENYPAASDNSVVYYEIFYCENFDTITEPDYKMIATVPSGLGRYRWKIGNTLRSNRLRIAIRGVNTRGERSKFAVSAADFAILKASPQTPTVMSPLPNSRYDSFIKFIFDESSLINTYSQRAKYFIYFSSESAKIPTSLVAQNIPIGTGPIVWDTADLPSSTDYKILLFLQDDDGNKSKEITIDNISIIHDKYFYIDTEPPTAYIQINNGDEYTKQTTAFVKVFVHDETTNVHSMQIFEIDKDIIKGSPQRYTRDSTWNFNDVDGLKTLRLQCQDFGGNRIAEVSEEKRFRNLHDYKIKSIVDIIADTNKQNIYVATNNSFGEVYKFSPIRSFLFRTEDPITSLGYFDETLHVAVQNKNQKGVCVKWNGSDLQLVFSLSDEDSSINSLAEYKGSLFAGTQNKFLYMYGNNVLTKIKEFSTPIKNLYSDGNILYITLKTGKSMYLFDGVNTTEVKI